MIRAQLAILLVGTAAIVGFAGLLAVESPSPGGLAPGHAAVDTLGHLSGCTVCHAEGGLTAGCLACHTEIGVQLDTGRGFHAERGDCAACHPEHNGGAFGLMEAVAWEGGVREDFRHDHVAFDLHGKHAALGCEECHGRAEFALPDFPAQPRATTYLGLSQTCDACHEDIHQGGLHTNRCEACHGQDRFRPATKFDHTEFFPLTGGHAEAVCKGCHVPPEAADAPLQFDRVKGKTCRECHENPHRTAWTQDCEGCHTPHEAQWSAGRELLTADVHARTGFRLAAPHGEVACQACHVPERPYAERFAAPPRTEEACQACHEDAHEGQFQGRYAACLDCHERTHFDPPRFSVADHGKTFALEGAHESAECAACHKRPAEDAARVFVGTPRACRECHDDVHRGQFRERACDECHGNTHFTPSLYGVARHETFPLLGAHETTECAACHTQPVADGARVFAGTPRSCRECHDDVHAGQFKERACDECHGSTRFLPARYDVARHETFPLEGAHLAVSCRACHRADGGARRFVGTERRCRECHENPHGTQFRAEMKQADCTACHRKDAKTFTIRPFDHAKQAGYPLAGAHAAAACADCHAPHDGIRIYRGTTTRCAGCHTDVHRGQFKEQRCDECHRSTEAWAIRPFDHDRTSFPLDGTHRKVACSACHLPVPQPDGTRVTQYKPLSAECRSCHDFKKR